MASANFTKRALQLLAAHDAWRVQHDWEPIAIEIYDAVQAYFRPHNPKVEPHFLPGKPVRFRGEPVDLRMVTVTVRSKPFLVYYRYYQGAFQIRRIHHPRTK